MEGFHGFTGGRGRRRARWRGRKLSPLELSWMNAMTVSLRAHATKRVESRHPTALSEERATDGGIQQHLQNEILFPDDSIFYFSKKFGMS